MNLNSQHTVMDAAQERQIAQQWLDRFNAAIEASDQAGLAALFAEDGYWRDLLAHQWNFRALNGQETIAATLIAEGKARGVKDFALHPEFSAPKHLMRSGRRVVEAITAFRTDLGSGAGILRLEQDGDGVYRAWGLMTSLQSLDAYPEAIGPNRPERIAGTAKGENWVDLLRKAQNFDGEEPEALVIGAGHSGLMIAARLKAMGVRTLTIESSPRVGDIWRNRYHTLQLHNEIQTIDFPYVSYPQTWPAYLPKDMYAVWMEFYALAMELAIWTSVRFEGASFDEVSKRWQARLRMPDGSERIVRPQHLIIATGGVSGRKNYPALPGLDPTFSK